MDARIDRRVATMLRDPFDGLRAGGLVDEVKRLRAAGLEKNPSAAKAIGYREVLAIDLTVHAASNSSDAADLKSVDIDGEPVELLISRA